MTIVMRPDAVRSGWEYADSAATELTSARSRTPDAAGTDMADLATTLTGAAEDLAGVLRVALGVVSEFGMLVENCIADFEATDGNRAGESHGLAS